MLVILFRLTHKDNENIRLPLKFVIFAPHLRENIIRVMFQSEVRFIKNWMLPIAMVLGIGTYLVLWAVPAWRDASEVWCDIAANVQPVMIGIMLFLQFNVVAPTDMRLHKWHFELLALQGLLFILFGVAAAKVPGVNAKVLLESTMLCFIAPTAAAAGVITQKIGGTISGVLTYLALSNCLASLLIPLVVPLVHPEVDMNFISSFWIIFKRVFSLLIVPCALAWIIRFTLPKLQKWLSKFVGWAFYIWGISLMLSLTVATRSTVHSGLGVMVAVLIGVVSLVCCLAQFWIGRKVAAKYGHSEMVTAGQALGQKNTGFIIWLGFNFLTPVTSVAGGLYAIWHNLVNSYQLYKLRKGEL